MGIRSARFSSLLGALAVLCATVGGGLSGAEAAPGDPAPWLVEPFGDQIGSANAVEHIAVGDRLYFTRSTPAAGVELWTSDGTSDGTRMVKDIVPGGGDGWPTSLRAFGDRVVFLASDEDGRLGLWWSDGTAAGTIALDSEVYPNVSALAVMGDWIYYSNADAEHGVELWRTNGTTFSRLSDINTSTEPAEPGEEYPWDDSLMDSDPYAFAVAGNRLLFIADDSTTTSEFSFGVWHWVYGGHGPEVWAYSPGSEPTMLTDTPCSDDLCSGDYSELVGAGNHVYLVHRRAGSSGVVRDLWVSDGTAGGTRRIHQGVPATSGGIADAVPQGDRIWWQSYAGGDFDGLWVADPTGARRATQTGLMSAPTVMGDLVYYHPFDGADGSSLWATDGSVHQSVADVDPTRQSEHLGEMTTFRGSLYFTTRFVGGWDLWRSDGSQGGTRRIVNSNNGSMPGVTMPTVGLSRLYFFVANAGFPALWALDPDIVQQKASTTTSLRLPATATYGTRARATVTVSSPSGTPTGMMRIREGQTTVGSAALVGGTATVLLPARMTVGPHNLTADYLGSADHATSTSSAATVRVKADSALAMGLSRLSWRRGAVVTVTGTLSTTPTGTVRTGTILVRRGTSIIKRVTLTAAMNGAVRTQLPDLPVGTHRLSLRYPGSSLVLPATSRTVSVTVSR